MYIIDIAALNLSYVSVKVMLRFFRFTGKVRMISFVHKITTPIEQNKNSFGTHINGG